MKTLILSALLLASTTLLSQVRLGNSRSEIYKEFQEYSPEFGTFEDGTPHLSFTTSRAYVRHSFNASGYCTDAMVVPLNQGALNFYVEMYNRQYVIVSQTEWKMYNSNGIATIKLISYNDMAFFLWE
jgi:hypothetical protein